MKVVTSHQPTFAPYPMLFARAAMSNLMDFSGAFDSVSKGSDSFNHRVKIGNLENNTWLTAPVDKFKSDLDFMEIETNQDLIDSLMQKLNGFFSANRKEFSLFKQNSEFIETALKDSLQYTSLGTFNIRLFQELAKFIGVKVPVTIGYAARVDLNASEKILYQIQKSNADIYLSGDNGVTYLDPIPFVRAEMPIVYASQFGDFLEAKKFFTEHNLHTTSIISSIFKIPQDELKDMFSRIQKISDLL